jgi:hypothetical protein
MKYFPFKILILCILMPPVLFITSVQLLENRLQNYYQNEIEAIYIGDTESLLAGRIGVDDAIRRNIDAYLQSQKLIAWGVKAIVTVRKRSGTIVYPSMLVQIGITEQAPSEPQTPRQIANENYTALTEGFDVSVAIGIPADQFLSYAMLATYLILSILLFLFYYMRSARKANREAVRIQGEIDRLQEMETIHQEKLADLNHERSHLSIELRKVQKTVDSEKKKASRNEDEMIEEIEVLEKNIEENLSLQLEQEEEIVTLKEKIAHFEKGASKNKKHKVKATESVQKRFRTLYKSLIVHERAAVGFVSLTSDLQLKAEEIMLQLHDDPKLVAIKRKVFGKKKRETVFEVLFAYKGRLYYRTTPEQKIEVVAIGTKHTQSKDLTFLDQL